MQNLTPPFSFEDVCSTYSDSILKKIRQYIRDDFMVKDVRQEVFLKMWRYWPSYDSGKGSLPAWITVITTSVSIDYLRMVKSGGRPDGRKYYIAEREGVHLIADTCLLRSELLKMAYRLSTVQRDVLLMIYFEGLTQEQVSQSLHLPLGTVKTRQRMAIRYLRKMYGVSCKF